MYLRGLIGRVPRWTVLLAVVCFIAILLVYARSLGNDFVTWDDGLLIFDNPAIRGPTPSNIARAFSSYDPELYIPLTLFSYQLNYLVAGLHPWIYHLTNLLLHAGNAFLVGVLVSQMTRRRGVAFACALLFALHPLHTEAAVWASARKDVLSAFFFLLSVTSFLQFRETGERKWHRGSIAAFLLALLSKVNVVVLPAALLLLDWRERRFSRKSLIDVLPHILLSVLFAVIALFGKQGNASLLLPKLLISAKASMFYLQQLFLPFGFSVLYPYTLPVAITTPDLLASLILVCVLTLFAVIALVRSREPLFAWGWYLLFLLPSFGNFAKGKDVLRDVYFASDRYAYLASVGILFLTVLIGERITRRRPRAAVALLGCILLTLAGLAYRQSLVWRDTESLFTNVVRQYPNAHTAHNNLGALYLQRGRREEAIRAFQTSLQIRPSSAAYFNLGQMYTEVHLPQRAEEMYRRAIEQNPVDRDALLNLGVLLLKRGDLDGAADAFARARAIDDLFAPVHFNLGLLAEKRGRIPEAIAAYRRAKQLDPRGQVDAAKRLTALGAEP